MKLRPLTFFFVCLAGMLATGGARADVGVQLGPHAGVAVSHDVDSYLGFGLRLAAPSSPLTIQPTFAYVFDENQRLYHVGSNVLYEVPTTFGLKPYFGVGANLSAFALKQESATTDSEGYRLGLNLLAGARLDVPCALRRALLPSVRRRDGERWWLLRRLRLFATVFGRRRWVPVNPTPSFRCTAARSQGETYTRLHWRSVWCATARSTRVCGHSRGFDVHAAVVVDNGNPEVESDCSATALARR